MKATSEINLTHLVLRAGNDSKDQSIYCEVKGEVNLLCAQCKNRIGLNLILMVVEFALIVNHHVESVYFNSVVTRTY